MSFGFDAPAGFFTFFAGDVTFFAGDVLSGDRLALVMIY
jgi:hypothetical protein